MSSARAEKLATLLRGAGLGWALRGDPGAEERILGYLDQAAVEWKRRYGDLVDLLAESEREPETSLALLQTLTGGASPEIIAMVARIVLTESRIVELVFSYHLKDRVELLVKLDDGNEYRSTNVWDAQVLRHLGFMTAGGKPVIDGYYPIRLRSVTAV